MDRREAGEAGNGYALAALRLQLAWGVDEALDDAPVDRTALPAALAPRIAPPRAPSWPRVPADRPAEARTGVHAGAVSGTAIPEGAPPRTGPPSAGIPLSGILTAGIPTTGAAGPTPGTPASRAQSVAMAARTIPELREALAAFDGCPLSATAGSLVFSDGNPESGLVFVGEAPGAEEDRTGRPFVGPSGQLLDRMLTSIGLDRSGLLITNLIPWRPPGNRTPTDAEVLTCLPFLHRHLALLRPRHLVLVGGMAAKAMTGSTLGIRRLRGKWTDVTVPGLDAPVRALPMLHPAYLLRTPGAKREAWADLISLREALDIIKER